MAGLPDWFPKGAGVEHINATVPNEGYSPLRNNPLGANPNYRAGAASPEGAAWTAAQRTGPDAAVRAGGVAANAGRFAKLRGALGMTPQGLLTTAAMEVPSLAADAADSHFDKQAATLRAQNPGRVNAVPKARVAVAGAPAAKAGVFEADDDGGYYPNGTYTVDGGNTFNVPQQSVQQKAQAAPAAGGAQNFDSVREFWGTPVSNSNPPPDLANADPSKDFGAPDGSTVTQPFADKSIRKVVDSGGNVTYTNAEKYAPMAKGNVSTVGIDKAAIERGIAAERDLADAKRAAMNGGDGKSWDERNGVASLGRDNPWWLGQFEFGRQKMAQQAAQAQNAATLRGQDLTMQMHREQFAKDMQVAMLNNQLAAQKWGLESQKTQEEILKARMERGFNPQTGKYDGKGTFEQQTKREKERADLVRAQQTADNEAEQKYNDALLKRYGGDQDKANAHRSIVQQAHSEVAQSFAQAAKNGKLSGAAAKYLGLPDGTALDTPEHKAAIAQARDSFLNMDNSVRGAYGNPDFMAKIDNHAQQQVYDQDRGQSLRNAGWWAGAPMAGAAAGYKAGGWRGAVIGAVAGAGVPTARKEFGWDKVKPWEYGTGLPPK